MNTRFYLFFCGILIFPFVSRAEKPNFIVITVDDVGYGDIEPFGSKVNHTPHLTQMAKEGLTLTSFYAAAPVCTPSRAALMTGCYPSRIGLAKGSGHAVLFPGDHYGLNPDEITIAETLKSVGYASGCFGKWHLGDQPPFLPTSQGFDTYFGIPYSNDMWPNLKDFQCPDLPLLKGTEVVGLIKTMEDQASLCRRFTEETCQFIRERKDQPFFAYLPHVFAHAPRQASPSFMAAGKTVEQAQVEEIDWSVGEILKTVRNEGIEKKTLVIFTSDNGPAGPLSAGPLRGKKGSAFEGGHRVPTLAWWPGTVPVGSKSDELVTAMDLHPTFAELAGAQVPGDRVIDGYSIQAILKGNEHASTHYDRFFYLENGEIAAVRSGDWKLFKDGKLFFLKEDIGEAQDVSEFNPDISLILRGMIRSFEEDLAHDARPVGIVQNPKTLVPRPGVEGADGFIPTLKLGKK